MMKKKEKKMDWMFTVHLQYSKHNIFWLVDLVKLGEMCEIPRHSEFQAFTCT